MKNDLNTYIKSGYNPRFYCEYFGRKVSEVGTTVPGAEVEGIGEYIIVLEWSEGGWCESDSVAFSNLTRCDYESKFYPEYFIISPFEANRIGLEIEA